MDQYSSKRLGGVVLVVCTVFVPAASLFGEERAHPSLVDPASTKCAVCHTEVAATHPELAAQQECLNCHRLIEKSGKTVLVVEANRQSLGVADPVPIVGPADSGITKEGGEGGAPPDQTPRSSQPRPSVDAAAKAESAAEQPHSSKAIAPAGGGAVLSGDSHEAGMREFNRGNFDSAFDIWSLMLARNPDRFTLQVEVDTYFITVQSTIARYGNHSLYVLKKDNLYFVFSGLFATLAEASDALKLLPEPLQRGGAFPVAVRQITREN